MKNENTEHAFTRGSARGRFSAGNKRRGDRGTAAPVSRRRHCGRHRRRRRAGLFRQRGKGVGDGGGARVVSVQVAEGSCRPAAHVQIQARVGALAAAATAVASVVVGAVGVQAVPGALLAAAGRVAALAAQQPLHQLAERALQWWEGEGRRRCTVRLCRSVAPPPQLRLLNHHCATLPLLASPVA